ncbi:hypothetical protein A3J23_02210 [Candidatus Peregrinibacteria bacterium RIFCSPLOWO2_02_FULL_48_14]|nr:MAG: hypothetical protein A2974_00940 [Candidatus Peregrinibacteria bacterium RIFCSPLOWO2_01_FULL_48_20]OGJ43512.1 MAG: hypothetical protein A3J23_02210 [Candidatus Peregrinibacteria bacterium RIFCSPLOWO2_02_FULL_48_14]
MNTPIHHKNFKGQFEDEQVLCYFRQHWALIVPRLALLPLAFILIFLGFVFLAPLSQPGFFGGLGSLLGILILVYAIHRIHLDIFRFYLHTVVITNCRIVEVDRSVFLKDSKTSIDLANIQDIQKKQYGLMQTLFNYGSLVIVLSGTSETLTLTMVPRPEYQFKKINQVKSMYMPKRNLQLTPPSFLQPETPPERAPLGLDKSLSFAE